jgi:hypothetical protein
MQSFLNYIACGFIGDFIGSFICGLHVYIVSYAPRPMMNTGLGQGDNNSYALFDKLENAGRNANCEMGILG